MKDRVNNKIYKDSVNYGYDAFQRIYRKQFDYIYRGEYDAGEWNHGCKEIGEEYFELYKDWTGKRVGGSVRDRYKILLQRACLKRLLKPCTDATELYWNLYEEVYAKGKSEHRVVIDNSDSGIKKGLLRKIAEEAMKLGPSQIELRYSETIAELRDYARSNHKNGLITKKGCRGSIPNYKKYQIGKHYDSNKSRAGNIEDLGKIGIKVSESTLARYGFGNNELKRMLRKMDEERKENVSRSTRYRDRKKNGEVHARLSDDEILKELDGSLGVNRNKEELEKKGMYVSKSRVSELLKRLELKETPWKTMDIDEGVAADAVNEAMSGQDKPSMFCFRPRDFDTFFSSQLKVDEEYAGNSTVNPFKPDFHPMSFSIPSFKDFGFSKQEGDDTNYWQ